ncbi:MAG: mechanosensitive ion channel [Bacteroidales bacterium]|nr:mechanosensitive ion channel [Bacteroidales bacterium]
MILASGDTLQIQPILLSEISTKIEEINNKINKINDKLQPDPKLIEIDSIILQKKEFLQTEQKRTNETLDQLSLRKIDDVINEWKAYSNELKNYRSTIIKKAEELESNIEYLSITIKTWELTNKTIKEQKGPAETQSRVREEIAGLKSIEKKIRKKQDQIFKLQNNITDLILLTDQMINILEKEQLNWQSEYFRQDSPALWNTSDTTFQRSQFKDSFSFTLKGNIKTIKVFVKNNSGGLYLQLFIFIALVLIFYLFHRKIKSTEIPDDDRRMQNVRFIFRHYFSSPVIFTILLSLWIHPDRPGTVTEFLAFILIIPSLILYFKMIGSHLRVYMYVIIGIFIIDEFQLFFGVNMLYSRIVLLIQAIITLWVLYSLINPKSTIRLELKGKWWNFVYKIAPIFFIFIIASIVANLLGYVNLAILLTDTVVNSILFAIALSIVSGITISFLIVLFQTKFFRTLNLVKNHQDLIEKRIALIVRLFVLFLWFKAVLRGLGIYNQVANWFLGLLESSWKIGPATISFGGIINFLMVIVITSIIVKIINVVLEEELFPRIELPRGVPGAISMIVRYFIVGYGIYIALEAAGVKLSSFSLMAGALGVGIGFGLQNIVANFISGLVLAFERPIQNGDTIEIGTLMGDVKNIGVRASTIKTFDGSEVIVPNSNLITHEVTNWTLSDRKRRRDIPVSVAYGNNPREVLALIDKIATDHPAVLKNPKPWATFEGFGESSLNFKVRFWVSFDIGMTVKSEVAMGIYDALQEAGIQIPFPQQDLHIKSFDPTVQKTVFPGVKKEKDNE